MSFKDLVSKQRALMNEYDYDDRMKLGFVLAVFILLSAVAFMCFPGSVAAVLVKALLGVVFVISGIIISLFGLMLVWANLLKFYDTKIKGD